MHFPWERDKTGGDDHPPPPPESGPDDPMGMADDYEQERTPPATDRAVPDSPAAGVDPEVWTIVGAPEDRESEASDDE
jgi:hypothetical protein